MNIKEELIRQRDIFMSSIESEDLYNPGGKVKFEEMVIQSKVQSPSELENKISSAPSPSDSTFKLRKQFKSTTKPRKIDLIKNPDGEGIRN
jgi:hypothetical protein